ncbi:MAG: CoA transferase [Deltaproteobacteria bacterium]|nr:CoA transferase [Deltaproteobacteria bacterium]
MSWPAPSLEGVRVLDLTRLLPGPFASWQLAAMGADVLRVESPGLGDYARVMPPFVGEVSALYHVINRGKRSLVIDLKQDAGKQLLLDLVRRSDVVFEQFRPGVMDRLGLGYDVLKETKDDIILCSLTGYGQTGPLRHAAGHDMNYLALSGVLHMQGTAGGPPALGTPPTADLVGAWTAVVQILGALLRKGTTGKGAHLDVSMTDAAAAFAAPFLASWNATLADGDPAPERGLGLLNGGLAQYSVYATSDGGHLAVGALEPKFFARFAAVCGHPEWMEVPPLPVPAQAELRAAVAAVVATKTRDEWDAALDGVDCCVTVVRRPDELGAQAQLRERGLLRAAEHHGQAVHWIDTPVGPPLGGSAPMPGEHTDAVLLELGMEQAAIDALRSAGVVE